jgi:hypothetical protein
MLAELLKISCYTGAYNDAEALTPNDVTIGIDGNKCIIRNRKKADTTENMLFLPIPLEIIERYRNHPISSAYSDKLY